MGRKEWREMAGIAAVTTVLALGLLWPKAGTAKDPAGAETPEIKWPTIQEGGWELTLSADGKQYQAGEVPTVSVTARKLGDDTADLAVTISMTAESPTSKLSRVVRLPKNLWTHEHTFVADCEDEHTYSVSTGVKIPEGQVVALMLKTGSRAVMTGPLTKTVPMPDIREVSIREVVDKK